MFKESVVKKALLLSCLLQAAALVTGNAARSFEWNEVICETGDYIPISLRGVWGSSSGDVFFVGDAGHIFHYDGLNCYTLLEGTPGEIAMLYDVWGSSGRDVFAVGGNYGEILHYDGNSWSMIRKTKEPQNLYGIWGYSPERVFAVGDNGVILRYDGEAWSEMNSGTTWPLHGIWGSAPDDIYAVGYAGTVLHFDGMEWRPIYLGSQALGTLLYDVWGSNENDVYAVGESGRYVGQNTGIVYHYNGGQWSQVMLDFSLNGLYPDGSLYGVWGSSHKDVFAVGGNFFGGGILNYDGGIWREVENGIPSFLFGVWGSSLTDIYAVGFGYRILHYGEPEQTTSTTSTVSDDICPLELIYGEFSQETALLRRFRDTVVSTTPEGRELIKLYYLVSPLIIGAMEGDDEFKEDVTQLVDGVLAMMYKKGGRS